MSEIIKTHYKDEDIQILNSYTDVNNWKSEVTFIDLENQFYKELFSSRLIEKTDINRQDINFLQQELEALDNNNQEFLEKLRVLTFELEGYRECDDVHCDAYYLNHHQKFKVEIENFLFKNRNLKTLIYSYIKNGIKKHL